MNCSGCGQQIGIDSRFCNGCGRPIAVLALPTLPGKKKTRPFVKLLAIIFALAIVGFVVAGVSGGGSPSTSLASSSDSTESNKRLEVAALGV